MSEIKPPKIKRVGEEIQTKDDLNFDKEKRNHNRNQRFLDFFYKYILPYTSLLVISIIAIWLIVVMGHFIYIGDWNSFEYFGIKIVSYVVIFFFGVLSKGGLIIK